MRLANIDAWLWIVIMSVWVPFAVVAGFVDTWNTPGGRHWRWQVMHPLRSFRENHPRFAPRRPHHAT